MLSAALTHLSTVETEAKLDRATFNKEKVIKDNIIEDLKAEVAGCKLLLRSYQEGIELRNIEEKLRMKEVEVLQRKYTECLYELNNYKLSTQNFSPIVNTNLHNNESDQAPREPQSTQFHKEVHAEPHNERYEPAESRPQYQNQDEVDNNFNPNQTFPGLNENKSINMDDTFTSTRSVHFNIPPRQISSISNPDPISLDNRTRSRNKGSVQLQSTSSTRVQKSPPNRLKTKSRRKTNDLDLSLSEIEDFVEENPPIRISGFHNGNNHKEVPVFHKEVINPTRHISLLKSYGQKESQTSTHNQRRLQSQIKNQNQQLQNQNHRQPRSQFNKNDHEIEGQDLRYSHKSINNEYELLINKTNQQRDYAHSLTRHKTVNYTTSNDIQAKVSLTQRPTTVSQYDPGTHRHTEDNSHIEQQMYTDLHTEHSQNRFRALKPKPYYSSAKAVRMDVRRPELTHHRPPYLDLAEPVIPQMQKRSQNAPVGAYFDPNKRMAVVHPGVELGTTYRSEKDIQGDPKFVDFQGPVGHQNHINYGPNSEVIISRPNHQPVAMNPNHQLTNIRPSHQPISTNSNQQPINIRSNNQPLPPNQNNEATRNQAPATEIGSKNTFVPEEASASKQKQKEGSNEGKKAKKNKVISFKKQREKQNGKEKENERINDTLFASGKKGIKK
ncbi:hypothetical protein K502DRAFT_323826 [Neoconidiobolus thromboides FSU 785]|nr:hypothetical protein K502DRAFT_323826 [Neoconidiobolus thromboides FSU 785]